MPGDKILPSTETAATPQPPMGQDMKDLVTPGDNAAVEAEAQTEEAVPGGEMPGANEDDPSEAAPDPDEAPEEERSPT